MMNRVGRWALRRYGTVAAFLGSVRLRLRIASFQSRATVVHAFPGALPASSRTRIVVVVTHVSSQNRQVEVTIERLAATIQGILESLGQHELSIVVNTVPGRSMVASLPVELRRGLEIHETSGIDPMYLGFEAQRVFATHVSEADWFLYLEDDLVLVDSFLLEKLSYFNLGTALDLLLVPHRYEFWRGRKVYIDLISKSSADWRWNRSTVIDVGGLKFAEFANPHSGCYCLSRPQMEKWIATGQQWRGRLTYFGPRESAATGCLGESFRFYKPHPTNMGLLEIRHWGSDYAEMYWRLHGPP